MRSFTRRSARVEAIRLDRDRHMFAALGWLTDHGVRAKFRWNGSVLLIGNDSIPARLGQWLAYNPDSGEFTVWDEEQFRAAHSEVSAGV